MNIYRLEATYEQLLEARVFRQMVIRNQRLIEKECDYDMSRSTDELIKELNTYIETLNYLMEHN